MRIAVLVLGIIGSLTALAYSCGAAACAGVLGGMGEDYEQGGNDVVKEIIQGVSEVIEESEKRTEDDGDTALRSRPCKSWEGKYRVLINHLANAQ